MNRERLIELAYQRGNELNLNNNNYLRWIERFFNQEYVEDIGSGDITSEAILIKNKPRRAVLKAKQQGVVGGIEEVSWFYAKHDLEVKTYAQDAETIQKGSTILEVSADQKYLLATERIGLNVLQRMSGIATETRHLVDEIRGYKTKVAATRKTVLKYLDKKAVFLGGGLTHRFGLWDSILIKDNHLEALKNDGVESYVEKALEMASPFADKVGFIEIETTNQEDALKAARKFEGLKLRRPCIIMLDNARPVEIEETIEKLRSNDLYDYVLLEASGNITPENIKEYAKTEVDVVSMGYLTHSAKILNMSLEIVT